jgi:chromosome partitioning protein
MKVIAIYNIKGGVGKTTTTVNLSYLSTRFGGRSLVWDLDPQGAASFYFRIKPKIKGGTKKLLRGKRKISDIIVGTDYSTLDLVPADLSYRNFDVALSSSKGSYGSLRKLLKPVAKDYDYVFLDCPPSFSVLSENVFKSADLLVIPMIPTTLSVRTFKQLTKFLDENKLGGVPVAPFFTMVDRRKNMHLSITHELPKRCPEFIEASVPYASVVERMGVERRPLCTFAQSSLASRSYEGVWRSIEKLLVD